MGGYETSCAHGTNPIPVWTHKVHAYIKKNFRNTHTHKKLLAQDLCLTIGSTRLCQKVQFVALARHRCAWSATFSIGGQVLGTMG